MASQFFHAIGRTNETTLPIYFSATNLIKQLPFRRGEVVVVVDANFSSFQFSGSCSSRRATNRRPNAYRFLVRCRLEATRRKLLLFLFYVARSAGGAWLDFMWSNSGAIRSGVTRWMALFEFFYVMGLRELMWRRIFPCFGGPSNMVSGVTDKK